MLSTMMHHVVSVMCHILWGPYWEMHASSDLAQLKETLIALVCMAIAVFIFAYAGCGGPPSLYRGY